jgi:hypothetical protein
MKRKTKRQRKLRNHEKVKVKYNPNKLANRIKKAKELLKKIAEGLSL